MTPTISPVPIAAVSATVVGAIFGLLVGIGMAVYVGMLDYRKRREGVRTKVQYRGSLVVVPALCAGLGALAGVLMGNL